MQGRGSNRSSPGRPQSNRNNNSTNNRRNRLNDEGPIIPGKDAAERVSDSLGDAPGRPSAANEGGPNSLCADNEEKGVGNEVAREYKNNSLDRADHEGDEREEKEGSPSDDEEWEHLQSLRVRVTNAKQRAADLDRALCESRGLPPQADEDGDDGLERKEAAAARERYEDLLRRLGEVDRRLMQASVLQEQEEDDGAQAESVQDEASAVSEWLVSTVGRAEEWKRRCIALEQRLEEARVESRIADEEELELRDELRLATQRLRDAERRARAEAAAESKANGGHDMEGDQDHDQERDLDLFKARLESMRTEISSYKAMTEHEVGQLKQLLVEAQVELGDLKGDATLRERVILNAQTYLQQIKPWIGVEIKEREVANGDNQVRLVGVNPAGPAFAAGLRRHDIVEMVNGDFVQEKAHLRRALLNAKGGETLSFQVLRGRYKIMHFLVPLGSKVVSFADVVRLRRVAGGIVKRSDEKWIRQLEPLPLLRPPSPRQSPPPDS